MQEVDNLQIGTFGWRFDAWRGGFYPEDMPEEWMLDYYANNYHVVLVPESEWLNWDDDQIVECLESVEEGFGFYFEVIEICSQIKQDQLAKIYDVFSECASGIVVFSEASDIQPEYVGMPVTLVSQAQALPGWQWHNQDSICSGHICGVVQALTHEPKLQTALLQEFMKSLPDGVNGAPLLIKSDNISMTQVFNLKTIGEFLGY